jgi:multisubunit Na+/H+ antiporter MnhG subunit
VTFGPLGLVKPAAIRPIFAAWMGVALVIGAVVSRLILAALFYLVFTPVGLLFRLIGRDELRLRRIDTESYWTEKERPRDVRSYLRQS